MTIVEELRTAADKLAPPSDARPTLTGQYPDLDACYAEILRDTASTVEAVIRKHPDVIDESAHWLAPALKAARAINGGAR